MNKRTLISLSMMFLATAGIATSASAQEKTRAEVRQELIQAENNGSEFVTDTSYPTINPIFAQQAAELKQRNESESESGMGAPMNGSSESGRAAGAAGPQACVGPVSFCNTFFGS